MPGGRDTGAEAHLVQTRVWRRIGASARVALALKMSDEARAVSTSGIMSRHPEYTEEQARMALRRVLLGDALFRAAYPGCGLLEP